MKLIKLFTVILISVFTGCGNSHGEYNCPKNTELDRMAWQADCFNSSEKNDVKTIAQCSRQSKELYCSK